MKLSVARSRAPKLAITLSLTLAAELFLVFSAEALAVRQLGRFTGYSPGATALLAALLVGALALGYRMGQRNQVSGFTIREQLVWTLPLVSVFLVLALSPNFLEPFFRIWGGAGLGAPLVKAALYAAGLLAFPMLCLGYSLPALSRALERATTRLSQRQRFLLVVCPLLVSVSLAFALSNLLTAESALLVTLLLPAPAYLFLLRRNHTTPMLLYGAVLGAAFLFTLA